MERIPINIDAKSIEEELDFLIKREFKLKHKGSRKWFIILFVITGFFISILLFTQSNAFSTLIAISTYLLAFVWLIAIFVVIDYVRIKIKRNKWKKETIKKTLARKLAFSLVFDDEKLTFESNLYTSEIKWEYYKYYATPCDLLVLVKEDNLYDSLGISSREIPIEYFEKLKFIAEKNLPLYLKFNLWI